MEDVIGMHQSFRWKEIGIEEKLALLKKGLGNKKEAIPPENRNDILKFEHWIAKIEEIENSIGGIHEIIQPRIEYDLGYKLDTGELLILALFQPSTKNLFAEIEIHFRDMGGCDLTSAELKEMAGISEAAATLAWIGDAALKIGVLPTIWTTEITEAGTLTKRRQQYEKNANLARRCDIWDLYRHRIHFDPDIEKEKSNVEHIKGTLTEAILGIIFLKGGLKAVAGAVHLLEPDVKQ